MQASHDDKGCARERCKALEEIKEEWIKKTVDEKDKGIAEKDEIISEKDAKIKEIEAKLAALS